MNIVWTVLGIIGVYIYGVFLMGLGRRISARVQLRYGPPVYQNYIDILKLWTKKTNISHGIMFDLGPVFLLTGSIGTLLLIPIAATEQLMYFGFSGDIIVIMYLMVFGSLGFALAASQGANPFGIMGISRALTLLAAYELPFILGIVILMMDANSASLSNIISHQAGGYMNWYIFKQPLAAIPAFIALLGMMGKQPFDIPIAPQEIATGPMAEFGGKYLGIMMSSHAIFMTAKYILFVNLFLGGAGNPINMIFKVFLIWLFPLFVGLVYPRFKTSQAVRFFWGIPSLIGLIGLIIHWLR
ncbi:NADH-quinone oxidoreductase subunit H [candidate division WOR-3 bacterium]|nr:NADH-quinone oxidoreductase subunit H [candidate division WOR-3 bacterium]